MGKGSTQKVKCNNCGIEFDKYIPSDRQGRRYYCSRKCKNSHQSIINLGKNNPNFNKRWPKELREAQSARSKKQMLSPYNRWLSGTANRGKKFSQERIDACHKHRTKESYIHEKTPETRIKIGIKSKEKWTDEYKKRNRRIREEKGYWKPLDSLSNMEIYYKEANWIGNMVDLAEGVEIFHSLGFFNARKNPKGAVRDHIYSRYDGFNNGVFPEILRHPCNCRFITHAENVGKMTRSNITLEELFAKILSFRGLWKEQKLVVTLIESYRNGNRWIREKEVL